MPKVSVIIPCFNQLAYLAEAVESVKHQTFLDYEIIIINDGSTEHNAIELLNTFERNNVIIVHEINKGVSAARNKGISIAKGDYILPLDADDAIHPHFLKEAVFLLDEFKDLEIVTTGVKYFGALQSDEYLPEYSRKQHLLQNLFFNTSLFRKKSFFNVGGYDEDFKTGWEDWDFYLRLITKENQIAKIEKCYLYYRIKNSSRNSDLISERLSFIEQQLFKKYFNEYMIYFPDPISNLRNLGYLINEKENFDRWINEFKFSPEYRLGHFIIKPIKFLFKFFKKKL